LGSKVKKRKRVYIGHAFDVEVVEIELPNCKTRKYDLVNHHDSVTIVPVDEKANIWFVEQYRVGSDSMLLELPAGVLEPGEDPLDCAKREIREEIGMGAEKWQKLGAFYLAPGYSCELNHAFLAADLYSAPLEQDEDEFLKIRKIPLTKVYKLVKAGKIIDAKSIAALFLGKSNSNLS